MDAAIVQAVSKVVRIEGARSGLRTLIASITVEESTAAKHPATREYLLPAHFYFSTSKTFLLFICFLLVVLSC